MGVLAIPFPEIDPVALRLGPLSVKWYGLAYMAGPAARAGSMSNICCGRTGCGRAASAPFAPDKADDLLLYMTIGVLVGGRLGNVLFYEPGYYLQNPLEIPAVWKGGMAFHGGLIGSIVAIVLFARRDRRRTPGACWTCARQPRRWACSSAGSPTSSMPSCGAGRATCPGRCVFPGAGPLPRHPSQLYEAALEGLVLFAVLWWLAHARLALRRPGVIAGTFLVGYGLARSFCELFREPDFNCRPLERRHPLFPADDAWPASG